MRSYSQTIVESVKLDRADINGKVVVVLHPHAALCARDQRYAKRQQTVSAHRIVLGENNVNLGTRLKRSQEKRKNESQRHSSYRTYSYSYVERSGPCIRKQGLGTGKAYLHRSRVQEKGGDKDEDGCEYCRHKDLQLPVWFQIDFASVVGLCNEQASKWLAIAIVRSTYSS